ncbi:MAG: Holliday junction resolvase RuvX [Candidatus Marinimicrobia bacterium]|nr:Holliday junction resolvase RuvX [Candidatus Neomarinimicrobiota bacterium]MDD9887698.1 Holliday junction resolvase RuvX [Candidatus Neomarinimicrobiota bacterium]MDD9931894.1 Holliday junction resolvase RuvX [Candidatus Neomarinimicrobiota bacterium]
MGRFLAIDHGNKRVGLALSDPMKIIAKPFRTLTFTDASELLNSLRDIIVSESVEQIILGLPRGMKGQDTAQTKVVLAFAEQLKSALDIPIELIDERLSSVSAEKALIQQEVKTGHNKGRIDETAAAIFLQQYLDQTR